MLRATTATLLVIRALMKPGKHYGFALAKETGLGPGTLYPILSRLEVDYGWITSHVEQSPIEGKPDRKIYNVTNLGKREGVKFLSTYGYKIEGLAPSKRPESWYPRPKRKGSLSASGI